MKQSQVTVIGAGSWGTALAHHLATAGHAVTMWSCEADVVENIRKSGANPKYFPEDKLAAGIQASGDLVEALQGAELVVISVPSFAVREVAVLVKEHISPEALVVSTAKGLEEGSHKSMTEVICEEIGKPTRVSCLSGPSFSLEVLRGLPTAVTIAALDLATAKRVATFFHYKNFRVYTSTDVRGVEFGGVVKNIIALAVGILDGAGMGNNARAAVITRGLAEMQRLSAALGADERTVVGLSGLGDLLLTATGDLSRNRQVGLRLGKGEKLEDVVESLGQVAEAVLTTHKVAELARKLGVSMPIVEQVDSVLRGHHSVPEAITALLTREQRPEIEK